MSMILKRFWNFILTFDNVKLFAVLTSLFVSIVIFLHQQPFNVDGILYLKSAKAYLNEGLNAAKAIYPWPLYSITIAWMSKITHLSLLNSAYVLDAIFCVFITLLFVALVKTLNGSKNIQKLAVIIISFYPVFFHYRNNIMRGYGYLTFALASLLFLIYFMRQPKWRFAIAWGFCIVIATLFRVEGSVILLLAPLVVFLRPETKWLSKFYLFIKINLINIVFTIGLGCLILLMHKQMVVFGRLHNIIHQITDAVSIFSQHYQHYHNELIQHIFTLSILKYNVPLFIFGGILTIFIVTFIKALTPLYTILSYHAWRHRLIPGDKNALLPIIFYMLINLAVLLVFVFDRLFITGRFAMLLCLLLMLGVPFSIAKIYQHWHEKKPVFSGKVWLLPAIVIVISIFAVGNLLHIGPSKTYILKAGNWIQTHTAKNARVFINSPQLTYYANRPGTKYPEDFTLAADFTSWKMLAESQGKQFNYYVMVVMHRYVKDAEKRFVKLKLKPIKTFTNNFGDKIFIMQKEKA